jgi:hypothetical protein
MVQVMHRKRFAGKDHLVVVQPDGTLALIPSWMSEEAASADVENEQAHNHYHGDRERRPADCVPVVLR